MFHVWIEKHPKSVIIKHADTLENILLEVFDLRRIQAIGHSDRYNGNDVKDVEDISIEIAIKMILKLNDTVFRPIFIRFIEWATVSLRKKEKTGRTYRSIAIFRLLEKFFESLKVRRSLLYQQHLH